MNPHFFHRLLAGLILITIGVMFLLDRLGLIDHFDIGHIFSIYWPVIIIVFALKGVFFEKRLRYGWIGSYVWNLIALAIGVYFLARNLHWIDFSFGDLIKYMIPVVIILTGLGMVFGPHRSYGRYRRRRDYDWTAGYDDPGFVPHVPPMGRTNPLERPDMPKSGADFPKGDMPKGSKDLPPLDGSDLPKAGDLPPLNAKDLPPSSGKDLPPMGDKKVPPFGKEVPPPVGSGAPAGGLGAPAGGSGPYEHYGYGASWKDAKKHWKERGKQYWKEHKRCWREHRRQWREHRRHYNDHYYWDEGWGGGREVLHRAGFIGDLYLGQDDWELKPMNVSHFIGDTVIDLTRAIIPYGETRIDIAAFIGDVKLFIPDDMDVELCVTSSVFLGELNVLDRNENGFCKSMKLESPYYYEAEKKLRVNVSMFLGDVVVKKVG